MTDTARRWLLGLVALGLTGIGTELLLLAHYDDAKQWIPLALIAAGLVLAVWIAVAPRPAVLRGFQILMALFVVSGGIGMGLHFQANLEFQREVDPSITGTALVMKAARAKAPPALAPGAMIQLGLLGLIFTYQHPGLSRRRT